MVSSSSLKHNGFLINPSYCMTKDTISQKNEATAQIQLVGALALILQILTVVLFSLLYICQIYSYMISEKFSA